jgi:AcrR family transcriptional regulator
MITSITSMTSTRSRRRPAEVRELLLRAAERMFNEKGFVATTADEIAAEAGVARSVLYRHFTDKSDLFREAVLLPFVDSLRNFTAAWQTQIDRPWDDERLMRTMVGVFYDSFETHRETILTIALAAGSLDEAANAQLDEELERFFRAMLMISENEAHRREEISAEGLDLSIRVTLGSIAAAVVLSRLFMPPGDRRPSRDEIVEHISRMTLSGLRPRPNT